MFLYVCVNMCAVFMCVCANVCAMFVSLCVSVCAQICVSMLVCGVCEFVFLCVCA